MGNDINCNIVMCINKSKRIVKCVDIYIEIRLQQNSIEIGIGAALWFDVSEYLRHYDCTSGDHLSTL